MKIPVAVQLYTLREETSKDFIGTLEKVAEIGYKGVEFAGYGNLTASQMKSCLDRLGLKPAGSHVGIDLLTNNLDEVIEYNLEIENPYIVCPWAKYETMEEYLEAAHLFNTIGEKCRKKGLQFCYHNHAHEFKVFNGVYGLDILFSETDPELVKAEIDTYWVQYAGIDPVEYIKKYSGRCPLIHQKDMEAGEGRGFAEVGNGIMDIESIYKASVEIGAQWFIVEQDECKRPAMESVRISYENLRNMNLIW